MTDWPTASMVIAGLAALVALVQICAPYVRARTGAETRLQALETANVTLSDRLARVEQLHEVRSMPRGFPVVR